ncbi:MAG: glutathione peroxidase [Pseudomonadota bacterium]
MRRRTFLAGSVALAAGAAASAARAEAHGFRFASLDVEDGELALADFAGRPILIVNTASRCAFTPQYEALQALWEGYRDRGLVVIGAPSRDFGRQEYADAEKIKEFCEVNFSIDFPMTNLIKVKGPDAHPFYKWAHASDLPSPRWNFHKYLLDGQGRLVGAWSSDVAPTDPEILLAIDPLLPAA